MCHGFSLTASFFQFLLAIDQELADCVRHAGCPDCPGVLHRAHYRRKPRGLPRALTGDDFCLRYSFCCAREGCRRRCTPPSVRFLGRRVYLGFLIVLSGSASRPHIEAVGEALSVPALTIRRWRRWWQRQFARLPDWRAAALQLAEPIDASALPEALWARFGPPDPASLTAVLRFLSRLVLPSRRALIEG